MTVPAYEPDRYEGDDVTTVFPYNFRVFDEEHLVLTVEDEDGNVETLTLGEEADYTVDGVGRNTGEVTLAEALPTGSVLVISRVVPIEQEASFAGQRAFHGKSHDTVHDKLTMICQQLALELASSIKLSPAEDPDDYDLLLPTEEERASKMLAFDSEGNLTVVAALDVSEVAISSFGESLIEAANQAAALSVLGWSAFMQTLKAAADAAALKTLLGMSAFGQDLTDDANASAGLTTLGFSAFVKTLVAAANEEDFRALIGLDGEEGSVGTGDLEDEAVTSDKLANAVLAQLCQGRLTLTTATPVTTADVTGAGTVYFTPFRGNKIALYHDSRWNLYAFTEKTFVQSAFNGGAGTLSGKPYDVFIYSNAGTPTLELVEWTNDSTRATALAYQDGVLVKSGDATRRYLGTFYTTGANTTEDSKAKRYLWNYYNRVARQMQYRESTNTWGFSNAAADPFRQALGSTNNQLNFVIGVAEDQVRATLAVMCESSDAASDYQVGIGLDSTTTLSDDCINSRLLTETEIVGVPQLLTASYAGFPAAGRHALVWLEGGPDDDVTWYGDNNAPTKQQAGIHGTVFA